MGKVYLVGAGPGDPELLTVKAVRLLANADVVLHDALVSPAILALVNPKATVFDIGKRCGAKLLTQAEINALLIAYVQTSGTVIRLKGGDPSIFGRSGEELSALNEAGVEFEIVPGITTAIAAAASAQISLTDRRYASAITLMTAHRGRDEDAVEWDRLVTSGATIVIYMPGKDYRDISVQLQRAGLASDTPCVVVSHASQQDEQKLYTSLDALSRATALPAPSLLIVGRCASALERVEPQFLSLGTHRINGFEKEIF
ncbi:uroporphyrinogen-III C-methyltransferase [Candidatus Koribacter versatilis Ellin345]|uniref:uroporphyrinogen-III C-methyltransferase n=1 Tax=Koribacter versatilis (strain Ellin345) TaxID=204669 RepID=Q1IP24_KORVE|nr:uroporphyrinogen-III C-methyltransferase [Candidatus Koribacter versatilis]ABF41376.1 uroporphyrinogen-III C-methyltransferase [Candidatus Koribacter versatilis Ellin345]